MIEFINNFENKDYQLGLIQKSFKLKLMFKQSLLLIIFAISTLTALAQPVLTFPNANAMPGEQICLDVSVENFVDIGALQYSVNWDPTVLEFQSIENIALGSTGNWGTTATAEGVISFAWVDFSLSGETFADGDVIYSICFTAIGEDGSSSSVDFAEVPLAFEASNVNDPLTNIGIEVQNSMVGVGNVPLATPLQVMATDVSGEPGEIVCTDIVVSNFNDIISMQWTMSWNPTVIDFNSIMNLNPDVIGLNEALNFGTTNTDAGLITFSWNTAFDGITLNDGETLFSLCYEMVGQPEDMSVLAFINVPTPIEIFNSTSEGTDIGLDQTSGTFTTIFPPADPLQIALPQLTGSIGSTVCAPVTVADFNNILSMQFSLTWDPTILQFDNVSTLTLPNFDVADNIGQTSTDEGILTVSWFDTNFTGLDIPDDSQILDVCFVVLGPGGAVGNIDFTSDPTPIEVILGTGQETEMAATNGAIIAVADPIAIAEEMVTGTNCFNPDGGSIDLLFSGGVLPFEYEWSTGDTTQSLSGLQAGSYTVTITDSNVPPATFIHEVIVPGDLDAPVVDAGATQELNCFITFVSLDGTASSAGAEFEYEWQTDDGNILDGDTTTEPLVNSPGIYTLYVTNTGNGCVDSSDVVVTLSSEVPIAEAGAADTLDCASPQLTLDASGSSMGNMFYSWGTVDGNIVSGDDSLTPEVDTPGTYCLTVTDISNSCEATDCVVIAQNLDTPEALVAPQDSSLTCMVTTLQLDGTMSPTGENLSFAWGTDDGNFFAGTETLTPTVDAGGSYTLVVTNTMSNCTDSATVVIGQDNVIPVTDAGVDFSFNCNAASEMLDGTASDAGTILWSTTDGEIIDGENTLTPNISGAGTYVLNISNETNGCVGTDPVVVASDALAVVAEIVSSNDITCLENAAVLDATGSLSNENTTITWVTLGGNFVSGEDGLAPVVDAAGMYELTLLDTLTGCMDSESIAVESFTDLPPVQANASGAIDCENTIVTLDGTGSAEGASFTYAWTTSDGSILAGNNGLFAEVDAAGTYTLQVTNTETSCVDSVTVVVIEDIALPMVDAGMSDTLTCFTPELQLDASGATSTGAFFSYDWSTVDGNILSDSNTLTPIVDAPGRYTLVVTSQENGCVDSASVLIYKDETLIDAFAGEDTNVCSDTIILTANELSGDITGQWTSLGGAILSNENDPVTSVIGLEGGINTFIWSLSRDGCPDYDTDTIFVTKEEVPIAGDDSYIFPWDVTTAPLDLTANDGISVMDSWSVNILTQPAAGTVTAQGDTITFTATSNLNGEFNFSYELCNDICPDFCDEATVLLEIEEPLDTTVTIPNGITPNDDGVNDEFVIKELRDNPDDWPHNELVIFNRWGDVVYTAKPYMNDWTGTNNAGKALPQGTYYYVIWLDLANGVLYRGDVTILR